jgi:acyl-CoA synthetase (AMP-forming)/AMP-acid ligase II
MNIADRFTEIAKIHYNKIAVRYPRRAGDKYRYDSITFGELESLANKYANGLSKIGFSRGSKTLLFVRPSLKFPALVFALFKLGVVPVLIDPGMGRKNLLNAIEEIAPEGLIAEPEVHLLRILFSNSFKFKVTTKGPKIRNCFPLAALENSKADYESAQLEPDEIAAILFTSGGTGRPKGVVYTHKIYTEQTRLLQKLFSLSDSEIDLPCFPLFSLFTLCMGMTSCIPDMDPSRPAKADPRKLLRNIMDNKVTFMAGSPAIWESLADYCEKNEIRLPSVKYLVMFGAPVRNELHKKFSRILPNGTTYTPYGATECLPVSIISGKTILEQTAVLTSLGKGTCVGAPVSGVDVSIIEISDDVIENIAQTRLLKPYEIGEIIVKGDIITASYYKSPVETALTKIKDNGYFWHRIGDLGYIDDQGRIWFCGRKTHRVQTPDGLLCSVMCEAIFNAHYGVRRSALVGLGEKGRQSAAIVIERNEAGKKLNKKSFAKELLNIAKNNTLTARIKSVHFCDQMPVDVRHNIKIDRLKLANEVSRGKI